jgi:hypothetical protein
VLFALIVAVLASCTQRESPSLMSPGSTYSTAVAPYTLAFISRTYDSENNTTTFSYQLQNTTSPGSPATGVLAVFTDIFVQVPSCSGDPVSMSPPDGASLGAVPAGYGVTWGAGYDDNPDFNYSMTFAGDIPAGTVHAEVTRGGQHYVQSVTGPCEGSFEVSGYVFTDGDQDGNKGTNDLGIANVTVKLTDGESTQTAKTDSDGHYLFLATTGTYTVSVDSLTADNTDYNEALYADWNQTNAQSRSVTVGPASTANDFGWEPDIDHIIAEVDAGHITTNGHSYKWWRTVFMRAIKGTNNQAYTADQLLGFLHTIEGYALLDEYNFTPGNELQEAYDILNNHAFGDDDGSSIMLSTKIEDQGRHDEYAFVLRELLTFELNHVTGRGFSDVQLRTIIINWGEGVLQDNTPAGAGLSPQRTVIGEPGQFPNILTSPLDGTGTITRKSNGSTDGGGTGG